MQKQTEILVVGGGFAGIKLIRQLRNQAGIHITLMSDSGSFRYCPALYRTATGHRQRESNIPLKDMLKGIENVDFVQARAAKIDRSAKHVVSEDGRIFTYDYVVLALGVVTNYFGIDGLEEHSYGIKSADEVARLKAHLHEELIADHEMDKNYVVVGAGPTGVELSAALRSYLTTLAKRHKVHRSKVNIEVVEAAPRILPVLSLRASKLVHKRLRSLGIKIWTNQKVEGETDQSLIINGRSLPTRTVIWTAGMSNSPFFAANADQFEFGQRHKIKVDEYLQVDTHTFVIGDNADTPYSGLALTAVHNATYVAKRLTSLARGSTTKPYKPFKVISVIPVGPKWAIVQWGKVVFGGWLGSLLRVAADFVGYSDVLGYRGAWTIMRRASEHEENCPVCDAYALESA